MVFILFLVMLAIIIYFNTKQKYVVGEQFYNFSNYNRLIIHYNEIYEIKEINRKQVRVVCIKGKVMGTDEDIVYDKWLTIDCFEHMFTKI